MRLAWFALLGLLVAGLSACALETDVWDPIPDPPPVSDAAVGPEWPDDTPLAPEFDTPSWVTIPAPGRISIGWRTVLPTTARVELLRELTASGPVEGEAPRVFQVDQPTDLFHVDLGTLPGATGYRYRVILDGSGATRDGVFTTPGLVGWRFVQLAEFHAPTDSEHVARFAPAIREFRPQVVVDVGDMMNDGDDPAQWRDYLRTSSPWISSVILLPTHSNHVNGFLGNANLKSLFDLPDNERWYTTRYSSVEFVTLDSTYTEPNPDLVDEPGWVRDSMTAVRDDRDAPRFTIGAWHYPACSSSYSSRSASRRWVIDNLITAFVDSGGIDMALVGHDKYYERSLLDTDADPVVQVMTNAGKLAPGSEGGNEPECTPIVTDTETRSLARFSVTPAAIEGEVIDEEGAPIDRFTVAARAP